MKTATAKPSPRVVSIMALMIVAWLIFLILAFSGCAKVGSKLESTGDGLNQRNGSPNTQVITERPDGTNTWSANAVGPTSYATVDADGTQEQSTNVTPRRVVWDRDSGRLVVSSGSDISAKDVVYDAKTGSLKIGQFSTVASEPIRAGNEAYDRLKEAWTTVPAESRMTIIRAIEGLENIAPSVKDAIIAALTGL